MKLSGKRGRGERKPRPEKKGGGERAPKPEKRARAVRKKDGPRERKSASNQGKIIAAVLAVVAAAAALALTVGVIAISRIDTVFPNVRFDGMDIGGMSETELLQLLVDEGYEDAGDATVTVKLPLDYELTISAADVCTAADAAGMVDSVMNACHEGSAVSVAMRYLRCALGGLNFESNVGISVDRDAVQAAVANVVKELKLELLSSEVSVGEESIRIIKGASDVEIDPNEICSLIFDAFLNGNYETIVYDAEVSGDSEIDLQKVYDMVYSEPADAVFDPETGEVKPETVGMSFNMSEAQRLWDRAQYGDEVIIPLIVTQPEMSAEELESKLFSFCFCSKSTSLAGSGNNRVNNVTKAAEAINGTILMPGDEFSYNDVVGRRTAERGYLPAGAYSGNETVLEYGGGICQVSSMVYYCALYANLEISDRTCHNLPVGYLPPGLDATVSWGGPEFKFVNNRNFPVKIVASVEGKSVTVEMWGTDEDGSYVNMTWGTFELFDKEYTDVAIGYRAITYRVVYNKDGKQISRTQEAVSTYNYHPEDIKWPEETEEPEETTPPEETEQPEPTGEPDPTLPVDPTVPVDPTQPVTTDEPEITPPAPPDPVEPIPEPDPGPDPTGPVDNA